MNLARKTAIITSPKLKQLEDKKKWLIKDRRYSNALRVNEMIKQEKGKLLDNREEKLSLLLEKKIEMVNDQNKKIFDYVQSNLKMNLDRLISKKKEGENIMRIRMKSLKAQAQRKLSQHYRNEINRLRSSFFMAASPIRE